MDTYGAVVFLHATTILLFFIAHGASMAVAFRIKAENDPARVRALLDLSRFALGTPTIAVAVLGFVTGVLAGFMGGHWGRLWIWLSLVLFIAIAGAMTPLASLRLQPIRTAAGMSTSGARPTEAGPEDPAEMRRLLDAWNPVPIGVVGLTGFVVILWLMLAQPF
ncbi:MAG: DUF2269 domain-containing protein [Chloroflexota bacterium]|nr:DUF2269 domain-containing protein [Chloroflexota bacterium]